MKKILMAGIVCILCIFACVFVLQGAMAQTAPKEITVKLDTTMYLMGGNTQFVLQSGSTNYKVSNRVPTAKGPYSFTTTVNMPENADLRLLALPDSLDTYFSIVSQEFKNNTLTVTLGRKIGIAISNIKNGATFIDFGPKHNIPNGVRLRLLDENDRFLRYSYSAYDFTQSTRLQWFKDLTPGNYLIEIDTVPNAYKNYDLSTQYQLHIAEDGQPTLQVFDGTIEKLHNPQGATDSRFDGSPVSKLLTGTKHPFFLLINKKAKASKWIENTGILQKQLQAGVGDIVNYQITVPIYNDHNVLLSFGKYIHFGVRTNVGFEDVLDSHLEYVENSLECLLNGTATTEFHASYDATAHKITVLDQSTTNVVEFDFDNAIDLGQDKILTLKFKARVIAGNESILNTIGDDITEIVPAVELSVKKEWLGGATLLAAANMQDFLEYFTVEAYRGEDLVFTEPAKLYMKEGSFQVADNKDFAFTLHYLPMYSKEDLKNPVAQRIKLKYSIIEHLPDEWKMFTPQYDIVEGIRTVRNQYQSALVNFNLKKVWNMQANSEEYIPQFVLIQSLDKQETKYSFHKQSTTLLDSAGKTYVFTMAGKEHVPQVNVQNNEYQILGLPKTNQNGLAYHYRVEEVDIIHHAQSVLQNFTVESKAVTQQGEFFQQVIENKQIPPNSTPPVSPTPTLTLPPTSNVPKTGDSSLAFSMLWCVLSLVGMVIVLHKKYKHTI